MPLSVRKWKISQSSTAGTDNARSSKNFRSSMKTRSGTGTWWVAALLVPTDTYPFAGSRPVALRASRPGSSFAPGSLHLVGSSLIKGCQLPPPTSAGHERDLEKQCLLSSPSSITSWWCSIKLMSRTNPCPWVASLHKPSLVLGKHSSSLCCSSCPKGLSSLTYPFHLNPCFLLFS